MKKLIILTKPTRLTYYNQVNFIQYEIIKKIGVNKVIRVV